MATADKPKSALKYVIKLTIKAEIPVDGKELSDLAEASDNLGKSVYNLADNLGIDFADIQVTAIPTRKRVAEEPAAA